MLPASWYAKLYKGPTANFWATVYKNVHPILSDTLSVCLFVCVLSMYRPNVGVLWPNGWMDQDETWNRGRPRPCQIVLDGDPHF